MKTTRRHELQTNELANRLAHWIEAVKPYSRAALALVVAAVVAIFAWGYLSAASSRKATEGWNAYYEAMTQPDPREDLADISTRYAGTQVGLWARVSLADMQLNNGTNRLFADKKNARDELRQAAEKYRAILLETKEPMLLQRATFGLARAHEALGTPDSLADARNEYRSIGETWPDSPYATDAKQRAGELDQAATKNFYDWLARYEPPRPVAGEPGTPGARPDFLKDPLEGTSGLQIPSATDDTAGLPKFGDEPKADETPKAEDAPLAAPASDATPAPSNDKPPAPTADAPPPSGAEKPSEPQPQ